MVPVHKGGVFVLLTATVLDIPASVVFPCVAVTRLLALGRVLLAY